MRGLTCILVLLATPLWAAQVSLTCPASVAASAPIDAVLTATTAAALGAYSVVVTYSPATVVSAPTISGGTGAFAAHPTASQVAGVVSVASLQNQSLSGPIGTSTLAHLGFTANSNGDTVTLTMRSGKLFDTADNSITPLTLTGCTIRVKK